MLVLVVLAACQPPLDGALPPDTGATDTDTVETDTVETDTVETDTEETDPNQPPTAPEIAITPTAPAPGLDFSVGIVTPSTDPDGDPVSYTYAWTRDGAPAMLDGVALDGATVPGASAAILEVWAVTVTPTDGRDPGPSASTSVTIGNSPPIAPVISLTPEEPTEGDDLELHFDVPAVDPDGDPLTTTIRWYDNDSYVSMLDDLSIIPGRYVDDDELFLAVVSTTDGFHDPVVVEASVYVTYSCTSPPPEALSETTFPDAVAYHGLVIDDDGYLIGWNARSALFKAAYSGGSSLFVPTSAYVQQMDRLEDGDFVVADMMGARLMRLTAAGALDTYASGVGAVYGVTVGPDGDTWVANGGVVRVDKDTRAVTTVIAEGSMYAHSLNFNLDSTVLYVGTIGSGVVYQLALDADLNGVGSPTPYAYGVGSGYHDGLEVDECGNLYVADYSSSGFYRVETDGTVTPMVAADPVAYGHGTRWGTGVGGWRADAIYQPQPYNNNTVREVVIGFQSGDTVRTWNGVAAPL